MSLRIDSRSWRGRCKARVTDSSQNTEREYQVNRNHHIRDQLLTKELGIDQRVSQRPDTRK